MNDSKTTNIADAIPLISISILITLIEKYPTLKNLLNTSKNEKSTEEWNYYFTAAGSGLVLMSTENHKGEHNEIINRLIEMDKTYPNAIDDFIKFMNKFKGSDDLIPVNVGLWVLWNLKKEQPSDTEVSELASIIGRSLLKIIYDWRNG